MRTTATPVASARCSGNLLEEAFQVGTNRCVGSPESNGWIREDDLPPEKVKAVYHRIERDRPIAAVEDDR